MTQLRRVPAAAPQLFFVATSSSAPAFVTTMRSCSAKAESPFAVYVKDIEAGTATGDTWLRLAHTLNTAAPTGVTTVKVGDRELNVLECWLEALRLDNSDSYIWSGFAAALGPDSSLGGIDDRPPMTQGDCLAESLRLDVGNAEAWYHLAYWLIRSAQRGQPGTMTIADVERSPLECFAQVVQLAPKFASAWHDLADHCRRDQTVNIVFTSPKTDDMTTPSAADTTTPSTAPEATTETLSLTKRECYVRALLLNPKMARSLINLGATLGEGETVDLRDGRGPRTQRDLFVAAVEAEPTLAHALCSLAAVLGQGETVVVNGAARSEKDLLVDALRCDPTLPQTFYNLGHVLAPGGADAPSSFVSVDIGDTDAEGKRVETTLTRRDCFARAVRLNPHYIEPLLNLTALVADDGVDAVEITPGEKPLTYTDLVVAVLRIQPEMSAAWSALGHSLWKRNGGTPTGSATVQISMRKTVGAMDCFIQAVLHAPKDSAPWNNLGLMLMQHGGAGEGAEGEGAKVRVNGEELGAREIFVMALRVNPDSSTAYINLGNALGGDASIDVNGVMRSKTACYIEALRINPKAHPAWFNLSLCLSKDNTTAIVNDEKVDARACLVKALSLNPAASDAWLNLASLLADEETVEINGEQGITKAECVRRGSAK
jgi:tetratricopeptide (TPR) repeat protein